MINLVYQFWYTGFNNFPHLVSSIFFIIFVSLITSSTAYTSFSGCLKYLKTWIWYHQLVLPTLPILNTSRGRGFRAYINSPYYRETGSLDQFSSSITPRRASQIELASTSIRAGKGSHFFLFIHLLRTWNFWGSWRKNMWKFQGPIKKEVEIPGVFKKN